MSFLSAICLALAVNPGRIALWVIQPLILCVLYLVLRARHQRIRAAAIAEDRRRIAVALHDGISQQISGARILLYSVKAATEESRQALKIAGDVLESARCEIRDAILDLQGDDLMAKGLEDLLRGFILKQGERLAALDMARLHMDLRGLPAKLPVKVKKDVLAIVQEAISNAVRHGHAKNVRIASGPLEGGGFRLSVMNDGERFDPERALGPETGHFGLSAMRERATRSGFTFAFRERDGYFGLEMERKA